MTFAPRERGTLEVGAQGYPEDITKLLSIDITEPGWQYNLAIQKSFYVIGSIWLMKNVLREVTKLQFYKDELDEEIERRTSWQRDELLWYAPFSPRQAIDALSIKKKTPLQFIKAAHTIILCEMALRESQKLYGVTVNTSDLYRNMYIEPALFYIEGFDTFYINRTSTQREQVLAKLSIETRQRFSGVFVDMAHGATVTYSLAKKVKEIMDREYQGSVGEIDFRFHHMSIGASRMEHLINL